jgi:hypothetical protein
MRRSRRQPEQSDNAEANAVAEKPMTKAEAAKAMERFRALTGRLLTVSREQIAEEERRHQAAKPLKSKRKTGTL